MNEINPTKFETVMIIDDNNIDLYVASRLMVKNNFSKNVLEYSFAQHALQYLRENQGNESLLPQVIFVDIYMPVMSGFQFMEAYDALDDRFKNSCKVYIISSTIDDMDIDRAKNDVNVVAFKEKPITKGFLESV